MVDILSLMLYIQFTFFVSVVWSRARSGFLMTSAHESSIPWASLPIIVGWGRGGVLLLLGAGDGLSHKLHQPHLGVDHGAHHGDDPQHRLAAQHGARGFTHKVSYRR